MVPLLNSARVSAIDRRTSSRKHAMERWHSISSLDSPPPYSGSAKSGQWWRHSCVNSCSFGSSHSLKWSWVVPALLQRSSGVVHERSRLRSCGRAQNPKLSCACDMPSCVVAVPLQHGLSPWWLVKLQKVVSAQLKPVFVPQHLSHLSSTANPFWLWCFPIKSHGNCRL